jgi:hypothetical protein
MAEMDGLKKRVGLIDTRLKSAHSAREKESAALMKTWEQIRDRFQDQSAEIVKLRSQIADLEDSRDDLLRMVHSLLEAVEGGLDSMADETVPQIKNMAGQLMSDNKNEVQSPRTSAKPAIPDMEPPEYERDQETASAPAASPAGANFHDDLLMAIERTIDSANEDDYVNGRSPSITPAITPEVDEEIDRSVPASPGIRNLVARIENAVGEEFFEPPSAADDKQLVDDDDLSRDLREIEALRDELHGLRHRISAGAL